MLLPLRDRNPTERTPYVTYGLIAINTAVMVWLTMLSPIQEQLAVIEHGFIPARIAQLTNPQLEIVVPLDPEPAVDPRTMQPLPVQRLAVRLDPVPTQVAASLLTTMFMHGGWIHLIGNMWFLWIFGNNVEDRLGHVLYTFFYLGGGLLATSCHWAYDPRSSVPLIGASGAVATILGAYAMAWPKSRVQTLVVLFVFFTTIEIPALAWLGFWFVGQLSDAFFVGHDLAVAVWAHIGGFVAGAILMLILSFESPPPGSSWEAELKKRFSMSRSDWEQPERR